MAGLFFSKKKWPILPSGKEKKKVSVRQRTVGSGAKSLVPCPDIALEEAAKQELAD